LINTLQGVLTVQKPFTYALLLAAMLGLAACDKTPEDKVESAKESAAEAIESMGDAIEETGAAIEQKADEVMGSEPTTGEKIEEAASDATDAIEEAASDAADAIEDTANDAADAIGEAGAEVKDAVDGQ
jgi:gas vesicle protein